MQNVYRLGTRKGVWLAVPIAIALGAATALLWPQSPASSVLIANRDLPAGTEVSSKDFNLIKVQLAEASSVYLSELPERGVLVERLAKGQLIARSQVAPSPARTLLPTVLQFKDPLPAQLRVGSAVDVWATERVATAEPAPIALGCEVANLRTESSLGQKSSAVEVNCEPEFLPSLLRAKATEASVALVLQPTMLER